MTHHRILSFLVSVVIVMFCVGTVLAAAPSSGVAPDAALKMLKEGNARFVAGKTIHPRQDQARRTETSGGQHPFATILSCSDSRDPVEVTFDEGIGDLFVVRVAGNVAHTDEIATLEYGSEHLGARLIMVMGHTKCGAVTAVVNGDKLDGSLPELVDHIVPAAERAKASGAKGDQLIQAAIKENVWQSIKDVMARSEIIREMVKKGQVQIVGGIYDIQTGAVEFLGAPPETETHPVAASH